MDVNGLDWGPLYWINGAQGLKGLYIIAQVAALAEAWVSIKYIRVL